MKLFWNLLGMAGAGYLGYVAEPGLRQQLTGVKAESTGVAETGKVIIKSTDGSPDREFSLSQMPKRVQILSPVSVDDAASGLTMTIDAGKSVRLLRVEGTDVIVSPGESTMEVTIPVSNTDLFQQLGIEPAKPVEPPPAPAPEPAPEPTPEPAPAPETATPPPAGESAEPPAMPEPPPTPEPAPAPVPIPEPSPVSPEPAGEQAPADGEQDPAKIVVIKAMQDSIKAGQIKEFTYDQVMEWEAGGVDSVDGESFQTGTASYTAETIFGKKAIQAKALIKNGKVARWIWPKSGMEIK